jgi:hypothetical protein
VRHCRSARHYSGRVPGHPHQGKEKPYQEEEEPQQPAVLLLGLGPL